MGNPLPNNFAPTNSGNAVINGDGDGYNSPTTELLNLFVSSAIVTDKRRVANIGEYAAFPGKTILSSTTKDVYLESVTNIKIGQFVSGLGVTGSTNKVKTIDAVAKKVTLSSAVNVAANTILSFYNSVYPNKYMSPTLIAYDAENDWPVLRYSDVLLMKAEADGKDNPTSLSNINLVHQRAGLPALINSSIDTSDKFEKVLSLERRLEFAFENQRWFDLLRYNVTFQNNANKAEAIMDAHFANTYSVYQGFSVLPISLAQLQANANPDRFLLPIPQYEIDTNSFITIPQNPSY
jgi:hypothetical protein